VDIRLVARYIGGHYKEMWEIWGPSCIEFRTTPGENPRTGFESEYLYDKLIEFGRKNPEYHIVKSQAKG
jgi:hypothetical protein